MFDFLACSKKYEGACAFFWPGFGYLSTKEADDCLGTLAQTGTLMLTDVVYDSRRVRSGSLYVAITGQNDDGLIYVQEAVRKGAMAIVAENIDFAASLNIPSLLVKDSREALGYFSYQAYFSQKDQALDQPMLVACCGRQGRETNARFLGEMLRALQVPTAISYEMQLEIGSTTYWTGRTKNQAPEWMAALKTAQNQKVGFLMAPVSPLDIRLKRMTAYPSYLCLLDQDMDLKPSSQAYYLGATALIVELQQWRPELAAFLEKLRLGNQAFLLVLTKEAARDFCVLGQGLKEYWQGLSSERKLRSAIVIQAALSLQKREDESGIALVFTSLHLQLWAGQKEASFVVHPPLFGGIAVENWLRAYTFLLLTKELNILTLASPDPYALLQILEKQNIQIPGHSQLVYTKEACRILIDSAWRPEHLEHLGKAFRPWVDVHQGRILLVFGSGGNRSYVDRLEQGKACAKMADELVLTVTNPRSEEAIEIMQQLQEGCQMVKKQAYPCFANRLSALKYMLQQARPEDLIVLAGRGEEAYSIHRSGLDLRTDRELIDQAQAEIKAGFMLRSK